MDFKIKITTFKCKVKLKNLFRSLKMCIQSRFKKQKIVFVKLPSA